MEGRGRGERPSWELASVRNAARLLKEFSRTDRELGVSELARRLGLATSTVHRMLATLAAERLLERTPTGYRLGLAGFDLGAGVVPRPPAPTTSTGKVLLASLPPEELDVRLRAWTPQRVTPYTIVEEATLRA